jgi:hypothetical protein
MIIIVYAWGPLLLLKLHCHHVLSPLWLSGSLSTYFMFCVFLVHILLKKQPIFFKDIKEIEIPQVSCELLHLLKVISSDVLIHNSFEHMINFLSLWFLLITSFSPSHRLSSPYWGFLPLSVSTKPIPPVGCNSACLACFLKEDLGLHSLFYDTFIL